MRVFLDFDGTISQRDVVDVILESYADPAWRRVEEEWQAGRIGSRECLRAQMSLVRATEHQMDALLDRVELDDGFSSLLQTCARHVIPVHIVSDGFDYCIRRIVQRTEEGVGALMRGVQICSSHLEPAGAGAWRVDFPFFPETCAHGCATCKPEAMRLLGVGGPGPIVFVGDGLSDRYAAAAADTVFAKGALATLCLKEQIGFTPYQNLRHVGLALERMFHESAIRPMSDRIPRGRVWAP